MLYHVVAEANLPVLRVSNVGWSADPQNNRFGPGKRNIWLIHYVTRGRGYFNGNPVSAGQGFLIYRGQTECYYPDNENPWEFLWITLDDDNAKLFFEQYDVIGSTQIFNYDFPHIIKNIMHFISQNHQRILKNEEILELFLHIFNHHKRLGGEVKANEEKYVSFAVNYIKTHLHTRLRVCELASILGISQSYLLSIFRESLGVSPKQYISELKLHTAKKLLSETRLSITEISNSVGFDDVLSFSRFFSREVGMSPTSYRRTALE